MKVGIDLGYRYTKIKGMWRDDTGTNKGTIAVIPSITGEPRNLKYQTDMDKLNELDYIRAIVGQKEYFVGSLADRQSDVVYFSMDERKLYEESSAVLLKTAIALLLLHSEGDKDIRLVTGLPVTYYADYKNRFAEVLDGEHKVLLNLAGSKYKRVFNIDGHGIRVIPQPLGTLFMKILDTDGKLKDKALANKRVGVIDIGFKTTDLVVCDKLEYIDKLSRSTTTAMHTAYQIISDQIREQFGVDKPVFQLDEIVRSGFIKIEGKTYSLQEITDYAFRSVAEKLIAEIKSLWPNRWELETIILTGGGAEALGSLLAGRLETSVVQEGAQMANVQGYTRLASRLW